VANLGLGDHVESGKNETNDSWICNARKQKRQKRIRDQKNSSKRTFAIEEDYYVDEDAEN
jgi:hypothetical protein